MGILDKFDDVLVDVSSKSKRAVAAAQIKSGIKDIKAEKAKRMVLLGEKAYGQYVVGKLGNDTLSEDCDVIADLDDQERMLLDKLDELDKVPAASTTGFPCPECGKDIKQDSVFCAYCGVNVPEERKKKEDGSIYCLECRTQIAKGMEFCPSCGSKVEADKKDAQPVDDQHFCLQCGAANKPDAAFCRGCGMKLEAVEEVPEVVKEPEPEAEPVEEPKAEEKKEVAVAIAQ